MRAPFLRIVRIVREAGYDITARNDDMLTPVEHRLIRLADEAGMSVYLAVVDRNTADPLWLEPAGVFGPFDTDATALGWFAAHAADCVPGWDTDQSLDEDGPRWFWYTFAIHPGTPEAVADVLGKSDPGDTHGSNGFRPDKGTRLVYIGPPAGDLQPGHLGIVTAVDPPPALYVAWDCGVTTTVTDETTVSVVAP